MSHIKALADAAVAARNARLTTNDDAAELELRAMASLGLVKQIRFDPEFRDEACITLRDGTMFTLSSAAPIQVHRAEVRLACLRCQMQVSEHFAAADSERCPDCGEPLRRAVVKQQEEGSPCSTS